MKIIVRTELRPTEDREKVVKALTTFFDPERLWEEEVGDVRIVVGESKRASSLLKLYHALRRQRILDAARTYLRAGRAGDAVVFYLHKQVAYAGKVSFCSSEYGESPLGAIRFEIRTNDPDRFINWLTPRTVNGRPVGEEKPPHDP